MESKKGTNINIGNLIIVALFLMGIVAVAYIYQQQLRSKGVDSANWKQERRSNAVYINSVEDLLALAEEVNAGNTYDGKHVVLQCDLDLQNVDEFYPIGICDGEYYFNGIFDGQGYTIKNLRMKSTNQMTNTGLFGALAGTICNLTMEDCYFSGTTCGSFCSVSATEEAKIYNCIARNIIVDAQTTGILAGEFFGITKNCLIDGYECRELADMNGWLAEYADIHAYNNRLYELSSECHNIPMCLWTENLCLNTDLMIKTSEMYIYIDNLFYNGKIFPCYRNNCYYFILPCKELQGNVTLHVPEEKNGIYTIIPPEEGIYEQHIPLQNGLINVIIGYAENTPSVFVDSNTTWGVDYLKASKVNVIYGGHVQVLDEHGQTDYKGGMESIHGRGNDSWKMPKKGFTINFIEDANLLGMGTDKEYALLPGYRDSSLLTYKVVQELAKEMGLEYAPEYQFVNLYLDGGYQGLYVLAEKMNIGYNRINIDCTNRDVSGGYLYEFDNYDYEGEMNLFTTKKGNTYVIRDPFFVNDKQLRYSLDLWEDYEEAVYSPTGYNTKGVHYSEYIDVNSLAQLWLFLQINGEYSVGSSLYFYKDSDSRGDGKLHALYPWDVEHSLTVEDYIKQDVMHGKNSAEADGLWPAIYQHPDMKEAVYRNWVELFRPALCKLLDKNRGYDETGISYIAEYGKQYEVSSRWNEFLWGNKQSLSEKGKFIEYYLEERIPYLDEWMKPELQ